MHVVAHVSAYYDHEPVPTDFDTSTVDFRQSIAAGLVKASARGGYVVRVHRQKPTHVSISISESEIMQRVLHHALPQNGSQVVTRREAVADYVAVRVLPDHAHPMHVTSFEVSDDAPSEDAFRAFLAPYVAADNPRTGQKVVPAEMVERLVAAYMQPADASDHVAHLHAKFNLPTAAPRASTGAST